MTRCRQCLESGLPGNPENCYLSRRLEVHPGNRKHLELVRVTTIPKQKNPIWRRWATDLRDWRPTDSICFKFEGPADYRTGSWIRSYHHVRRGRPRLPTI